MDKESFKQRLSKVIAERLKIAEQEIEKDYTQDFSKDLEADSLDVVEILMDLEDEFELEIPDEEAKNLTTPQLALDYLIKHAK